jgi:hypothetical protein
MVAHFIALLGISKNKGDMTKINIIDNVAIKNGRLRVIDRFGGEKRVFLRQGDLEGECAVYSLMMMLMLHKKIYDDELCIDNCMVSSYAKQLRKLFLYRRRMRGYNFEELQEKLLKVFDDNISVNIYTSNPLKDKHKDFTYLYLKIKKHIDAGWPVQMGFFIPGSRDGHSVVVVGYAEYAKSLRLFCLDPSWNMPYSAFWNNIIDVNLDKSGDETIDYEHMAERYILVTEILLIDEELDIIDSDLPF